VLQYLERHVEGLRVRVREHLCGAFEHLHANVARHVQYLVDGVRMLGLLPYLEFVRHRIVDLHVLSVRRLLIVARVRARLSGSVLGRDEPIVVVVWRVVAGHLVSRGEEAVVTVAEVAVHVVFEHGRTECVLADTRPRQRGLAMFSGAGFELVVVAGGLLC
jgi:hypothetical protein